MKSLYKHIIGFLLLSLLLSSCEKEQLKSPILFGLPNYLISTKAAFDSTSLISSSNVFVFGKRNNTENVYSGMKITRNAVNGIWYPQYTSEWNTGSYTFRGLASSATISSISTNVNSSGATLSTPGLEVFNSGLSIRVNQPVSNNQAGMIDYLLSKVFNVSDGSTKPLVTLQMEHSMPAVEVYVIKAEAMYEACLESITLTGLFSSGTMSCPSPLSYGTTGLNVWTTSLSGDKSAVYSTTGTLASKVQITDSTNTTSAKLKIMTMPQALSSDATLTIKYWINERTASSDSDNYVEYTGSFRLFEYIPQNYVAGHKITYVLKVDSGIHLAGTISEWTNVDFIEGTVLPAV